MAGDIPPDSTASSTPFMSEEMFYAQFVLSKKGPLAKIWLAAHWEKKLSKAQIYETSVQDAVGQILEPQVKMALRTTGHLLLGIVRIYSRKTKYLLADCNEAFLKIKMAFRPGQAELLEDGKDVPSTKLPGLPEIYTDFDAALPDVSDYEFANHMQINQSRLDDITLKEDLITENHNFGDNFGMDDFGEAAAGVFGGMDQDFAGFEGSAIEEARRSACLIDNNLQTTHTLFGEKDNDFGGAGYDDDMGYGEMMAPGADMNDDLAMGAAANEESFALEPLDVMALDKPRRNQRKRRLIIDESKNIGGEEMKNNMSDYSDTLQSLDLAPPTRKLMKMKETGTVEKLFQLPGCSFLKAKPLVKLYQSNLVMRVRSDPDASALEVRRDLEMSERIEEEYFRPPIAESHFGADDYIDFEMPYTNSPPPMADYGVQGGEEMPKEQEQETHTPDKRKRKSQAEAFDVLQSCRGDQEKLEEEESIMEGDEDHRWTKRTQGVLNSIATKLKSNEEIILSDLLSKASTRKNAAQKFYTLLVLKKWQAIDVRQDQPYGDIYVSAGPNIAQTVQ